MGKGYIRGCALGKFGRPLIGSPVLVMIKVNVH